MKHVSPPNYDFANKVWDNLRAFPAAHNFLQNISQDAEILIFGGVVRDYLANGLGEPRDYDFVVNFAGKKKSIAAYAEKQTDLSLTRNRFGGFKITFYNKIVFDVWELQSTWAFKNHGLFASVSNLLKSVYLNIDSFVYSMQSRHYIDNCDRNWATIMQRNQLDIVFPDTPFVELNLLRAIVYKDKYRMRISSRLQNVFYKYCGQRQIFVDQLVNLQLNHYGYIRYDKSQLATKLNEILS